eukprot:m.126395 g.126395  ORF g.126395 m.126395 type:complete len:887 (+) comp16680_c0_seq2:4950-7610(+)
MSEKNDLQEYCQKHRLSLPKYDVAKREGEDHFPKFWSRVVVAGGTYVGSEFRHTRKEADKLVAREALIAIRRSRKAAPRPRAAASDEDALFLAGLSRSTASSSSSASTAERLRRALRAVESGQGTSRGSSRKSQFEDDYLFAGDEDSDSAGDEASVVGVGVGGGNRDLTKLIATPSDYGSDVAPWRAASSRGSEPASQDFPDFTAGKAVPDLPPARGHPVVVVTGCSGRIGRAVCVAFLFKGCLVRGLDVVECPRALRNHPCFEFTKDQVNFKNLVQLLKGNRGGGGTAAVALVHLAAVPDDAEFETALVPHNIEAVNHVFDACRKVASLNRIVIASSGKIFVGRSGATGPIHIDDKPEPRCMYAATKLFAEAAAQAYACGRGGKPTIAIRFAWCPRTAQEVDIMRSSKLVGEASDEFLSPRDAADCTVAAALCDLPADFKYAPVFCQSKVTRPGGKARFDLSSTEKLLGWKPQHTFPDGIDEIIAAGEYNPFYAGLLKPRTEPASPPPQHTSPLSPLASSLGSSSYSASSLGGSSGSGSATPTPVAGPGTQRPLEVMPASRSEVRRRVTLAEWQARVELAQAYRVFHMLGWTHLIHTHITVKVPSDDEDVEHFLINALGQTWDEITASSLVKVEANGDIIDHGSIKDAAINPAGFKIHSAIHASDRGQPGGDVLWTMHTHTPDAVAVASLEGGLLPGLSQYAMDLGEVTYHKFKHATTKGSNVCERLVEDLGDTSKCILLRNHGCITVGKTVHETFFRMFQLLRACEVQVKTLAMASATTMPLLLSEVRAAKAAAARAAAAGSSRGGGGDDSSSGGSSSDDDDDRHHASGKQGTVSKGYHEASSRTVKKTFSITEKNYTGQPFGYLEWQAAVRQMERQQGKDYAS